MEKSIDSNDYYVESRKAIDIALAKEDKFHKDSTRKRTALKFISAILKLRITRKNI